MKYLSVCSGIEAASVAWHHLGWEPVGFSEIEPFPSAVLAHRFPNVPNFGDMTKFKEWPIEPGSIDILVGGTPCQSFSVAGLRAGLEDPRGGLMLTYLEIARRLRPRWIVWENVPGVLSSAGGRDFGSFLGALGELGYGWAYRVLDDQWVRTQRHPGAVPQRRRRVFVVGCLGDPTRAAQVLFERESVQRDSSTRRTKGQGASADAEGCAGTVSSKWAKGTGGPAGDECYNLTTQPVPFRDVSPTLTSRMQGSSGWAPVNEDAHLVGQPIGYRWQNNETGLVQDGTAPSCRASAGSSGFHEMNHPVVLQPFTKAKRAQSVTDDETWVQGQVNPTLSLFDQGDTRATTAVVNMQGSKSNACVSTDGTSFTLNAMHGHDVHAVALGVAPTLTAHNDPSRSPQSAEVTQQVAAVHAASMTVRRLTPRECERLQGFPDDWTLIPWRGKAADQCPDGPRYKALGNSMAVNCMEWIGERIAEVSK